MMQSAPANAVKSAAIWTGFARFQEEEADADAALPEQHRFFFYRTTPGQKTQARNRLEKTSIISIMISGNLLYFRLIGMMDKS